jgi:hypothetical protein
MMLRFPLAALAFVPFGVHADTIPCTHRYIDSKVREFFNFVQEKPDVKTGVQATKLEDAREIRQAKLTDYNMLVRYCEGRLRLSNGEMLQARFRVGSREDYKRERAEDLQICWEDTTYGETSVIDQSLGCKADK